MSLRDRVEATRAKWMDQPVRVLKILDVSDFVTDDLPPAIGSIGRVVTVNTANGVVGSVGVEFEDRSWVFPVDHVTLDVVTEEEVQAAIQSITQGKS